MRLLNLKGGWRVQAIKALLLFAIAVVALVFAAAGDVSFLYEAF